MARHDAHLRASSSQREAEDRGAIQQPRPSASAAEAWYERANPRPEVKNFGTRVEPSSPSEKIVTSGRVYWRNRRYIRPNTVIENGGEEKVDPAAITDSVPQAKRRRGRPRRQDNKPAAEPSRRSSRIKHPPSRYGNS